MWRWRGASRSSLLPFLLHQWYASHLQAPWPAVQHGAGWSLAQVRLQLFCPTMHFGHPVTLPGVVWCFPSLQVWLGNHCGLPVSSLTGGGGSLCTAVHISHPELSWVEQHHAKPPSCLSRVHPLSTRLHLSPCGQSAGWVGVNFKRGGLWGLTGEASIFKKCQLYLHGHPGVITTGVARFTSSQGDWGSPPLSQQSYPHPLPLRRSQPHTLMLACIITCLIGSWFVVCSKSQRNIAATNPKYSHQVCVRVCERRGDGGGVGTNHLPPSHKSSFQSRIKALGWFGWSDYSSVTLRRINQLSVFFPSVFIWRNHFTADV